MQSLSKSAAPTQPSFSPINTSGASNASSTQTAAAAAFQALVPVAVEIPSLSTPISSGGPISCSRELPKRPRPGRKADPNPAPTKKGQSNRLAQQKHRQKKKALEEQNIDYHRQLAEENKRLARAIAQSEAQNRVLKRQVQIQRCDPKVLDSHLPASPQSTQSVQQASLSPVSEPTTPQALASPVVGGCGGCVEGGSCACVDSMLETGDSREYQTSPVPSIQALPLTSRRDSTKGFSNTVSIQSLLSTTPERQVAEQNSTTAPKQSNIDNEIDFTKAFISSSSSGTYDPIMSSLAPNRCGACPPDEPGCLCRKASVALHSEASSSSTAVSRATSAAANGPGSCARCQADPQQRAWCQNLALQAATSPSSHHSDLGESDAKRPRLHYETISCAEAYDVQQRFSPANGNSRRMSSRVSAEDVIKSVQERPREYSAFEVDIGTVLSNLRHSGGRKSE
ncbi:hypothetical protein BT63DRAFT_421078 [Microthyrium microscopicum]|uniref:BZIP domain-containing protein n=1 Tax=Microthyrium microscopicum TaxID=703497 RepID=A0A6A6UKV0_9PEZI|nr:hypothetical protein BT63DRAFT_421078 [Microthyrium microscopicum]